jgi:hypothetical protein
MSKVPIHKSRKLNHFGKYTAEKVDVLLLNAEFNSEKIETQKRLEFFLSPTHKLNLGVKEVRVIGHRVQVTLTECEGSQVPSVLDEGKVLHAAFGNGQGSKSGEVDSEGEALDIVCQEPTPNNQSFQGAGESLEKKLKLRLLDLLANVNLEPRQWEAGHAEKLKVVMWNPPYRIFPEIKFRVKIRGVTVTTCDFQYREF